MGGPGSGGKPRIYPADIVEAVRRLYITEGMTVVEVQAKLPAGYKAQRIIERHISPGERHPAAKRNQRGQANDSWRGDAAGYAAAHLRFGKASEHACQDCGSQARDWSYEGGCTEERTGRRGNPYCTHRGHYSPRCKRCHHVKDGGLIRRVSGRLASWQAVTANG